MLGFLLIIICCVFELKSHINKTMMCGTKESNNQFQSKYKQQQHLDLI